MLWILKYFSINNKYTFSSSCLCYIMRKECILNIPEHCSNKSPTGSLLLRVCSCTSHYVYASFQSQNQIWRLCLATFITQVWLKILSWNFVQVSNKYIPTPPENIINIHLTTNFFAQLIQITTVATNWNVFQFLSFVNLYLSCNFRS